MAGRRVWHLHRSVCLLLTTSRLSSVAVGHRIECRRNLNSLFISGKANFAAKNANLYRECCSLPEVKPKRRRRSKKELTSNAEDTSEKAVSDDKRQRTLETSDDAGVASSEGTTKRRTRTKKATQTDTVSEVETDIKKPKRRMKSSTETTDSDEDLSIEEKPKKRTRQKKAAVEAVIPEPSFPFEGSSDIDQKATSEEYSAVDDEFGSLSNHSDVKRITTSRGRYYQISTTKGEVCYPSVTTVLKHTMAKNDFFRLLMWKKSMIKEHGVKGFELISREVKQVGTNFHQDLEARLLQNQDDSGTIDETTTLEKVLPSRIERSSGYMQSVEHVLSDITDIQALEGTVSHYELGYTGTFDCVAKYRDKLCLIDWKTSSKPKPTIKDCYEYPLQVVAYAGAINEDPHYSFKVYNVLIVVAYPNGEPAHAHYLSHQDCLGYWSQWLQRLNEYQTQHSGDLSNVYV